MFQAMVDMNNAAKPVDIVTLQEALKEKDVPPEVYSLEFIRELLAAVPTSANIRHYATIVKDKAILRNIIRVNDSIATACYEGKESTEDILADTEKRIFELVKNKGGHEYMPIDKVVLEALDKISIAAKTEVQLPVCRPDLKIWTRIYQAYSRRILYWLRRVRLWVRQHLS